MHQPADRGRGGRPPGTRGVLGGGARHGLDAPLAQPGDLAPGREKRWSCARRSPSPSARKRHRSQWATGSGAASGTGCRAERSSPRRASSAKAV